MGEKIKYFYCYSAKLRRFLKENDVNWVDRGFNEKSGYPYWVFAKDERFNKVIIKYNK